MPFQVTLASGKEIETSRVAPGGRVSDLRQEIAEQLDQNPRCLELNSGGSFLSDDDKVPDSEVTAVLVQLVWVGARPDRIKDLGGGEFEIIEGSKSNALCEVGFSSGTEYFEIEVVKGSGTGPFIGVTTKAGFKDGYKIRGLFFGGPGNLINGAAAVSTHFGQPVKQGSVVGISLDLTDEKMVGVTFWDGDTCLGQGFKDCPREPGAMVFPAVCGNSVGDRFKLSLKRLRKPEVVTPHPAVRCWDLKRLAVDGELVPLDAALSIKGKGKGKGYADGEERQGNIVMVVTTTDNKLFKVSLQLANTLRTSIVVSTVDGKEELQVGMVVGTMVMAPPPLMDLEQRLCTILPLITSWSIGDSSLELRGGAVEMDFLHYDAPLVEPVSITVKW